MAFFLVLCTLVALASGFQHISRSFSANFNVAFRGAINKLSPLRSNRFLSMVATEPAPKISSTDDDVQVGGGMFTSSSPETKRVVPTNMDGKKKFKVVYVVLENQIPERLDQCMYEDQ